MKISVIVAIVFAATLTQAQDQVKSNPRVTALSDSSTIQPMMDLAYIPISSDSKFALEPGVRATRVGSDFSLSTYDGKKIEIVANGDRVLLASPTILRITNGSLDFGTGRSYSAFSALARLSTQDDTDTNLKSMQDNAKKLKAKSDVKQDEKKQGGALKGKWRFLFTEDPMATAELFNAAAIQQLTHTSPIGF